MNWIDFILLVPVLYGLIRGLMRGAVLEIASFLGIIIALFVARLYAPVVSYHFESWLDVSDKSAQIIAFGTVFLVTLILIQILARLIDKFLSALSLGCFNKIGGAIFGALKLLLITSFIVNVFAVINANIPLVNEETVDNSKLYNPVKSVVEKIIPHISKNTENNGKEGD